jgi:uncharacterized membrane protein
MNTNEQAPQGTPGSFEVGAIFETSWAVLKANLVPFIFIHAAWFAIMVVVGIGDSFIAIALESALSISDLDVSLFSSIAQVFLSIGITRIYLTALRGDTPQIQTLWSGTGIFLRYCVLSTVIIVLILAGFLFLLIPGIIASLGLCIAHFHMIDQNMGVEDSLRSSWAATKGHKLKLIWFFTACCVINLVGVLGLLVGLLITIPMTGLAFTEAYRRLSAAP